ncbi:MAG TPA: hypothetical protein VMX36_10470 [Sedimentisphaerales bacterium]|nr:hypothetical protein [Sedimentisphaerales bacterium]
MSIYQAGAKSRIKKQIISDRCTQKQYSRRYRMQASAVSRRFERNAKYKVIRPEPAKGHNS